MRASVNCLKALRDERRLSQMDVAMGCDISLSYYQRIEGYHVYPGEAIRRRMCLYFDLAEVDMWPDEPVAERRVVGLSG